MTDDEIIAVVQAHKDGAHIEERMSHESYWWMFNESWDFGNKVYRIKPKPRVAREWWIAYDYGTNFYDPVFYWTKQKYTTDTKREQIHVREVLPEEEK